MGLIYRSLRVGQHGRPFFLLKFRTMRPVDDGGSPTASVDDKRLTVVGQWLRRSKLDEIPTLWNVLKGDIAVCGPRPDVPSEIESLNPTVRDIILSVKPGLISPATLYDFDEDTVLKGEADPHRTYCERIKPTKYLLNVWYCRNRSTWLDMKIILATMLRFFDIEWRLWPLRITD